MQRIVFITALAAFATLGASAGTVEFSTSTSELCIGAAGCGLDSVTFGGTILSYTSEPSVTIQTPSFVSLGYISASCVGGGTGCDLSQIPAGLSLYLNIVQTTPASGSGSIEAGTLIGSFSGTNSNSNITWSGLPSTSISTNGVTTTYALLGNNVPIVPPSINNCPTCTVQPSGLTSIAGVVTQTSTPEPASILLLLTGLVGFVLARRKRLA